MFKDLAEVKCNWWEFGWLRLGQYYDPGITEREAFLCSETEHPPDWWTDVCKAWFGVQMGHIVSHQGQKTNPETMTVKGGQITSSLL